MTSIPPERPLRWAPETSPPPDDLPQRSPEPHRDATVLVTGATGGLGPAVVAAFLEDGWRVVATSRSGRPPQDLVGSDRLESVATDLFEPADVAEAVAVATADRPPPPSAPWSTWSAATPPAAWSTRRRSSSSNAS